MVIRGRAVLIGALVWLGCPTPAGAPNAAVDAGPAQLQPIDAGVLDAGPAQLQFSLTSTLVDGGTAVVDVAEGHALLEPSAALELKLPSPLVDARVRVMDWNDAVVESDDQATGLSYRIGLLQPLKSGRRYALLIDAETQDTFSDAAGRHFDEVRIELLVTGEVQPEPGQKPKSKKSKRR